MNESLRIRLYGSPVFWFTLGAIIAIAAALLVYLLIIEDGEEAGTAGGPNASLAPVEGSEEDLVALTEELGYPIYWVGEQQGTKIEIITFSDGQVYVRYLGEDDPIGDPRPDFMTVGTYPVDDPYGELLELSQQRGTTEEYLEEGGIAVQAEDSPNSAYLAWPGGDVQIEVYSPQPEEALRIATAGDVVPAG